MSSARSRNRTGSDAAGETETIAEKLDALEPLRPVFEAVQAVSGAFEGVYLVGGAVRDVLMGEPNFDVDIAVEGDGIALGEALAEALGGRVVPHDRFGTAIVVYDGGRVDVATARTEFYDSPGALPTVEQASIRQDLYRRDFTINAMAASLKGEDFGRLVDYFGGLRDLENGVVRVLHNLSFIDDPTRIFRAIRYENRYGLSMDAHTLSLARACVEMNLVGELSSARLRDELQALLSEARVDDSVRRLAELGIDRAIHPHLAADEESLQLIEAIDRAREELAPATPAWRLRLGVLARRLPPDELYEWFERLKLRRRDADRIADAVAVGPRLPELLGKRPRSRLPCARWSSLTIPTAPSSPMRSPGSPRVRASNATSPTSGRSASRSPATISLGSAYRSRPASAPFSTSSCGGS